ncbi:Uu.00g082810.m01.CDS01 [Anthostomella pinea]|uniref:Uu.00g082810.m01.CDS01 n=1 Tax=Anthostomella pinea TaxID=933095 RepID=A0AAI8YJJ2_9PEZI|nr:Uu.00g082810.m01.CDS01 [Anthostomella pinea]
MGEGLGQVISWYICTVVALLFAAARMVNQCQKFGRLYLEDGFLVLATCCLIGDLIIQQYMWNRGVAEIPKASRDDFIAIMQMIIPGSVLYVTSLWAIKVALVLFYRKLAAPSTRLQIVYNATLGFLAASWLVIFFDIVFQCYPNDKRWSLDPDYQCNPKAAETNYWITIILNIFSDVFIICLPISMVLKLQMKRKQKLGVMGIFALGFFVVIASIVRAYYSKLNKTMLTCTVSMVETAIAIIAACLPALRAIFLGHTSQAGNSSYGRHYELSSVHRHRTQRSQITTNIKGGTSQPGEDSDDELVREGRMSILGLGDNHEHGSSGIMVNTTFHMKKDNASLHSDAI